jgi:hypothetical protein
MNPQQQPCFLKFPVAESHPVWIEYVTYVDSFKGLQERFDFDLEDLPPDVILLRGAKAARFLKNG